jgi:hypothetical protein
VPPEEVLPDEVPLGVLDDAAGLLELELSELGDELVDAELLSDLLSEDFDSGLVEE